MCSLRALLQNLYKHASYAADTASLTHYRSQHLNYQPDFSENKVYTFDYETTLLSGLPEKGLARAGIKIKSKVEISGIGPKLCLIRVHSIEAAEYNGVWPSSSFSRSLKLSQVLTGQLSSPIKFEYGNGHVGNIMAPDSVSDDGLNIYRGIVNVLELSIKKTQNSYSLQEAGIGGICNTTYAIQENRRANLVYVTKSKDLNSCEEKVQIVTGSAYTHPCKPCQQRNKNSRATATYNYKIKYTRSEAVITQADVEEIHQFSLFNEITGGNAIVEARQKLALTDVQKQRAEVPPKEYQNRGSLQYQFGSELHQLPIHLFKIKDVESQIEESLQELVEATSDQLPSDAPAKALKLLHLFRAASEENYEWVWKQFSSRPAYRRHILDIIPAVASHRALRFLRHKMERQELSSWEVTQTVLVALHSSSPTRSVMEEATLLHGFAGEALSKSSAEDISLALKALGNVGHPASIKHIKKCLPGYAAGASDLPLRVHATAVMALKNIGLKDPKMVQAITLEIFLNQKIHPRIRMLAAAVLLETKPGVPIVMTLADAVLKEPSMQVASFIYSHLRALGRSTAPDLQVIMAIRALSPKFDRSGYQFSKVFRFSIFKEFLMSGLAAKYLVLNNAGSLIPAMAMSQLRTHFLGRVADPLEVGITVEGLQEMFAKGYSPDRDWETDYDFKKILKTLSDWKAFSSDKPFASGYLKMFGQELFFGELDKNAIQNALQAWYGSDEKIPSLRRIISSLQSGVARQWTKALLSSEIRHIVPTCTGFPTETSFYYSSITKVAGNVQAQITPSPKSDFRLTELLNANIRLRSKASLSMAKEMTFVMGINTHIVQAGLEAHTKMNAHVPVNVVATIQMREKSIKIEIPPCKDETNIISIRSKTFAVTRNIGDLAASKTTPVLSPEAVPNIMKTSFNSDSASGETQNIGDRQSAEAISSGNPFSSGHSSSQKEPFVQSLCFNASTFGVQVCIEKKSVHAAFIKNLPLYYLVGEHALRMSFKPVYTEAPIEKIQVTIQAGDQAPTKMVRLVAFEDPEAQASSRKEAIKKVKKILADTDDQESHLPKLYSFRFKSAHVHWHNFLGDVIPPGITVVAQAVRSDNRNQGYQATAYVRSDAAKVDVQLVVVQLAETNWKACADAVILPLKAQARLRWGKECQDYRIAAVATTGQLARKPAAQLKVQWGKLPSWIKKTSTAFMQYIPGAALVLGFSEVHQRNPSHEFIVRAAATSPRTIDTVIKAPEVTLYCQGFRLPFTLPSGPSPAYETRDITAWNLFPEIASQIAQEDQSTCEIREKDFKTFDRVSYSYSFNKSCNLVVVQDCTEHPKFIISTRKVDSQSFSRVVHLNTTSVNITICPASNSSLLVAYNEERVLKHSGGSVYEKGNVKIYKNGKTVSVEVPELGLQKVTFDGVNLKVLHLLSRLLLAFCLIPCQCDRPALQHSLQRCAILQVTVASWMRGKTCGVCGNNDREKENELLMPNHRLAHSCSAFVHSWVLLEETCSGGCKLQRSYVKLNRNPTVDGEESTCYSVDPVLKCMKDCTPIEKASVKVGFHCFPKGTAVSLLEWQKSSDKKSAFENVVESVDADIDCTCTGSCS
ncbi:hypothetical protein IHE44_0014977 [Lamprotornis superbus]|uniref:Phosvitin n=1 Tax=Lamprotornis superbus TaxID=245042 RepID=A0A835TUY2_9PASS|nr:hypothetical protein IHE44_0014977 [Lamprotornis superbus]